MERKDSKDKRQKARLKERAFKEIDSVMEALGVQQSLNPVAELMTTAAAALSPSPLAAAKHSLSNASLASSEGGQTPTLLPNGTSSSSCHPTPALGASSRGASL